MQSWGWNRIATVVALVVVIAACTDDGTDTAADLTEAADRTAAVDHLRYELTMGATGGDFEEGSAVGRVVIGSGELAGANLHASADPQNFGEVLGGLEAGFLDQTIETYTDGATTYLRSPYLVSQVTQGVAFPPESGPIAALGDSWGVVDRAQVASVDLTSGLGGTVLDLASAVEFARSLADEVDADGSGEVQGSPVDRFETTLTFRELRSTSGTVRAMLETALYLVFSPDLNDDAFTDVMAETELPVIVTVDEEGFIRSIAFELHSPVYATAAPALGGAGPTNFGGLGIEGAVTTLAIELYDIGDESVSVELPVDEATVDLTPWAIEQYGAAGG